MSIKKCTGCGRYEKEPLGMNKLGEPFLACCPDSNYKEVTAVEWLRDQFHKVPQSQFGNLFEQAAQMHREQIGRGYMVALS